MIGESVGIGVCITFPFYDNSLSIVFRGSSLVRYASSRNSRIWSTTRKIVS